jgi:hypothetical protein
MGQTPDRIKALRSVDDNSYILNDDIRDYIRERGDFLMRNHFLDTIKTMMIKNKL